MVVRAKYKRMQRVETTMKEPARDGRFMVVDGRRRCDEEMMTMTVEFQYLKYSNPDSCTHD